MLRQMAVLNADGAGCIFTDMFPTYEYSYCSCVLCCLIIPTVSYYDYQYKGYTS